MRKSSDIGTIDRMFTPHEDTEFRGYLRDRFERTMEYLEKASTRVNTGFLDKARKIFEASNSNEALRRTRDAIRASNNVKSASMIFSACSLDDLRTMGYKMQRFAMANIPTRKLFHKQRLDGYHDTHKDMEPDAIGLDHYDYRRAVDQVWMQEKDAEGEDIFVHRVFYEGLIEGDRDLDPEEKFSIADTWEVQEMFLKAGIDFSNRLGGTLG